ncbi:MAG: uridine diphosphate-N-acetylglucosamine-binding protein YvcK [Anaerolineae bacterium]|nr:uridine diphosphate-N-acetylglucosamine-binding protein YvcK [Anaerolineae bacterium]MDW8100035.1 uridine diphosphate-N-acetylglucosamine-binding protein YvcK [Anaerolineae bacterium]
MRKWVKAHAGSHWKWLYPGMQVKRWVLLLIAGVAMLSVGLATLFDKLRTHPAFRFLGEWETWRLPASLYIAGWGMLGGAVTVLAIVQLNRSLLSAFMRPDHPNVVDVVYEHRRRRGGPKVVAIGGGTGLSTLLRGLKAYTDNITAIVTVADDGGSSGRLRRELQVLPPGDFRNCIAALADDEALITQLFQYRFSEGAGLCGHNFGNLFIAAMTAITGSFDRALVESSRVLAVRGQVLPSTLRSVVLYADVREDRPGSEPRWERIWGESSIPTLAQGRVIERVFLQPEDPPAYPEAVRAILDADLIVIGPGSLFTSVLPNLLVPDITAAVRASPAVKVYVCNVATQRGETEGFGVHEHVRALQSHVGSDLFELVLANDHFPTSYPPGEGVAWVHLPTAEMIKSGGYRMITDDLVDPEQPWRHKPDKLARRLLSLYHEEVARRALAQA